MVFAPLFLLAASPAFEESFRSGLVALQQNDLATARSSLETAMKIEPGNGRVWVALAQTYRKLNETAKANAAAARAEAQGAKDPVVLSSLAIFYAGSDQTLKAADAQAKYAALVPGDAAARQKAESMYFDAAQPLLRQGKFPEAVPILQAGAERLKESAQLQLALGVAFYGLRRFDEAAGAFLRTIEIAPEIEQPYVFLGKFLDQIPNRIDVVTKKFADYEAANPASSLGYFLHAKAFNVQSIEPETARALLEKSLAINERDAPAHFELGATLDRTQHYPEAAREFERAAELAPEDAATHYRLARVYDRLGKREAAQAERKRHAELIKAQDAATSGMR